MDVKFKVDHMIKANCQNGVCFTYFMDNLKNGHPPQKYGTWAMFVFAPVDVCHSPIECISGVEREVSFSSCCMKPWNKIVRSLTTCSNLFQVITSVWFGRQFVTWIQMMCSPGI